MESGPSPKAIASGTLIAVAIASMALAFLRFGSWEFEPVRIELDPPFVTELTDRFEVELGGPYEVNVVLDRISGASMPWDNREEYWRPIEVTWSVTTNGREVAAGNSTEYPWNHIGGADFEGQTLGNFTAEAGVPLQLAVSVNSVDPRVEGFNPRICVWSDNRREPFHSRFFFFPALFWLGALTAVSGILVYVVPATVRWTTRRPKDAV